MGGALINFDADVGFPNTMIGLIGNTFNTIQAYSGSNILTVTRKMSEPDYYEMVYYGGGILI